jgi:phospholipase D1/2
MDGITSFLHGTLEVAILSGRKVEGTTKSGRFLKKLERAVASSLDGVDPYCSVKLGYNKIMQTAVVHNNSSPEWNETATFDVCTDLDALEFRVKAAKRSGALSVISKVQHLSMLAIQAEELVAKRVVEGWFPLVPYVAEKVAETDPQEEANSTDEEGQVDKTNVGDLGHLQVRVVYTPVGENSDLEKIAVPRVYFPARKGIKVKLYQDADVHPGSLPTVPFRPEYTPNRCWVDILTNIMEATEFIYITGWAVWPLLRMVRTKFPGDAELAAAGTLEEILKRKADQGVVVCVMVWDELASGGLLGLDGLMGTHDEELVAAFADSKVNAIKVPRINPKDGPFADLNTGLMFTHHQKTVITAKRDRSQGGKARVQAFVGGIDLTNGRYDNGYHSLFRTLDTFHKLPDFYQACALEVGSTSGPREPWHDIHSFVTGTSAWDVLANFEGRWKRQAAEDMKEKLHPRPAESFVIPSEESAIRDGVWSAQLLRSISEASTTLDTGRPGLVKRRNAAVDSSIHSAYVHQIRRCVSFCYIENQYFLGSSHMWKDSNQRGGFASHLVHIELAQKISAKIHAGDRFAVYVCVPMYPEGPPDSAAVQEILSHQRKSVMLITKAIAKAIEETGNGAQITDYFNMFCLVNRESFEGGKGDGGTNPKEKDLSNSRRFMIYNHSKFGSFDDTVNIIGSANINSRSLDGSRDTEICQQLWQPEYRATGSTCYGGDVGKPASTPKGDIAAFRCNVWSEHLGGYYPEFEDPASLECVRKVRELAKANWDHFASDYAASDMPHGHLALYPYVYELDGRVETNGKHFPDFPNVCCVAVFRPPSVAVKLTGCASANENFVIFLFFRFRPLCRLRSRASLVLCRTCMSSMEQLRII